MSHLNAKNQLQEICQRRMLPLPIYTYYEGWVCILRVFDQEFIGKGSNKKEASLEAASLALQEVPPVSEPSWDDLSKTCIIVDIENINPLPHPLWESLCQQGNVYIFASSKFLIPSVKCKVKICPSTMKDAADILICMKLSRYLKKHKFDFYYILTKDHFGDVLEDMYPSLCKRIQSLENII